MKVFHKECDGNTVGFACVVDGENFIEKRFSSEKETSMYCMALEDLGYKEVDAIFLCAWNKKSWQEKNLRKFVMSVKAFRKDYSVQRKNFQKLVMSSRNIKKDIISQSKGEMIMAKYFYVYHVNDGTTDRIVKMFNTDSVVNGKKGTYIAEKKVTSSDLQGFTSGIKAAGFQLNQELANADTAEQEAKRILAAKMADYHAARDAYAEAADNLKRVNAKFGI